MKMDKYESKSDKVFDLIDNPEKYTPQEITDILSDPEAREVYDLLCMTSSAVATDGVEEPDVDGEWATFAKKHTVAPRLRAFWSGSRAASIAVILCSSIMAVAAGIVVTVTMVYYSTAPVDSLVLADKTAVREADKDSIVAMSDTAVVSVKPTLFEDEALSAIMEAVATVYGVEVKFNNKDCADLHLYYKLDPSLQLDEVVEQLNTFEQINITRQGNTLTID